jgi:hypothetical protein
LIYFLHAREYKFNPQQVIFTRAYADPKSPTFGNALKSGLEAGYSESYSENITHLSPDWLSEFIGKNRCFGPSWAKHLKLGKY